MWRDLKTDPPTGDEYAVLLFPCKTPNGVLYTVSNPIYAKGSYALEAGYTHWANFELSPHHDEMVKWQDEISNEQEDLNSWYLKDQQLEF